MKTILLAEDDEMVSRMYERAFNFGGYEVCVISNGARVLDTLNSMNPSPEAIILDIVMPDMSGNEILQNIRANAKYDMIPVIILTNSVRKEQEQEFINAGADLFLVKMDNQAKDVIQKTKDVISKGRTLVKS